MPNLISPLLSSSRLLLLAALLSVGALSACNTLEGAGDDIENAGDSIEDAVD